MSVLNFETRPLTRFVSPLTLELADDVLNSITEFDSFQIEKAADVAEQAAGAYTWRAETHGRGSPLQGYPNETLWRSMSESPESILNFFDFLGSALQQAWPR